MSEQYRMDVKESMLHLAERNLLLKIFKERMKQDAAVTPCKVKLVLFGYWKGQKKTKPVLEMVMQRGIKTEELPRRLARIYQIKLHEGHLTLAVQVWRDMELGGPEASFVKSLVVDIVETLKLFANSDCFMKIGAEKLVAKIANETGIEDLTSWVKAYLARPAYMERPEVRRYYRLYNNHLNHAHPQNLLERRREDLIETPV
jgi:disulfide oxidoreductase YuzD